MEHISDEAMYDLADGELSAKESERAMAHVSDCRECRNKLEGILSLERMIRRLWQEELSAACPDEDTLFAFFEGRLSGDSRDAISKHLETCPVCTATVRLANDSLERFRELERAKEELAPSVLQRLRDRLGRVNLGDLVESLGRTLAPSRLGEELFTFLAEDVPVRSFAFGSLLETPAFLPMAAGGVKLADTGKGFQRKVLVEKGVPFEAEAVQFGERLLLNLKCTDPECSEALVRYTMLEAGQGKGQGVLLVSEGKGTVQFASEEVERIRPEERPLSLRLDVVLKGDVISRMEAGDLVPLLERLQDCLKSEDSELAEDAIEAFHKLEDLIPGDH